MLREKRIVKQPVSFQYLYQEPKRKSNPNPKKQRKATRCEFKTIPAPAKFVDASKSYPLLGVKYLNFISLITTRVLY